MHPLGLVIQLASIFLGGCVIAWVCPISYALPGVCYERGSDRTPRRGHSFDGGSPRSTRAGTATSRQRALGEELSCILGLISWRQVSQRSRERSDTLAIGLFARQLPSLAPLGSTTCDACPPPSGPFGRLRLSAREESFKVALPPHFQPLEEF